MLLWPVENAGDLAGIEAAFAPERIAVAHQEPDLIFPLKLEDPRSPATLLLYEPVALLHNSGRVTDRSQSCLNAIEFALTQACPGLTYDSVPHI